MKVWRFYIIPEKDSENKRYDLYAITNNKEFAKKFKKERNMDKFIVRCTNESKESYAEFANKNLSCVLDYRAFITKTLTENKKQTSTEVKLLSTFYEQQCCDSSIQPIEAIDPSEWEAAIPYKIYKKKIEEALRVLEYISHYKIYTQEFANRYIDPNDDDYSAPDIWYDEVGVFIRLFRHTFK